VDSPLIIVSERIIDNAGIETNIDDYSRAAIIKGNIAGNGIGISAVDRKSGSLVIVRFVSPEYGILSIVIECIAMPFGTWRPRIGNIPPGVAILN